MRGMIWWMIVLLLAVTIFALSNTTQVTVMFWQWPVYTGSIALTIVGAGVIGALLTLLPALLRQAHLGERIRELERERRAREAGHREPDRPEPAPGPSSPSSSRAEDTRRFP